jgi:hypothetical protein
MAARTTILRVTPSSVADPPAGWAAVAIPAGAKGEGELQDAGAIMASSAGTRRASPFPAMRRTITAGGRSPTRARARSTRSRSTCPSRPSGWWRASSALDGTWHRPFTTLELAALQSLFDPEEIFGEAFDLVGGSDATKREWIGNAVPIAAARGMAETIGETLLLAEAGETFMLSSREIWVKPLALALAVDPRQDLTA